MRATQCWPVALLVLVAAGCGGEKDPARCDAELPQALPFPLNREIAGEPLSQGEIDAFSTRYTAFLKQRRFFRWLLDVSHGVDASTGLPPWMVWWTGVVVERAQGKVTFRHDPNGGPDNIMIPTSKVLGQSVGALLLTQDADLARLLEGYSRGATATMLGMVWDENDTVRSIMARAVIANNHSVTLADGRTKDIDYSAWRRLTQDWNTHTIHVEHNPFWGDIYVKNMRSKDDVPHIYRAAAWLPWARCADDPLAREAAAEAYGFLQGFARDVVDSGYHIRTKDEQGVIYTPTEDLASFVDYEALDPRAECNAKLASALLGYGDTRGLDCADGSGGAYEAGAVAGHYYNLAIIRGFHMAAILQALLHRADEAARNLLLGLIARIDRDKALPDGQLPTTRERWDADLAKLFAMAAACGVPLTHDEARLLVREWGKGLDAMEAFEHWDVWDPALPDGTYTYRPGGEIDAEEILFLFEYCASPYRHPAGASFVDCERLRHPETW